MNSQEIARLKTASAREFAYWGVQNFAYIRSVVVEGQLAFAIHAANGTHLGTLETLAAARVAALQNDIEPLSVH